MRNYRYHTKERSVFDRGISSLMGRVNISSSTNIDWVDDDFLNISESDESSTHFVGVRTSLQCDEESLPEKKNNPLVEVCTSTTLLSERCSKKKCGMNAIYGFPNDKSRIKYCSLHRPEGTINLDDLRSSKKCKICGRKAYYGYTHTSEKEVCLFHKQKGMKNLNTKKCTTKECSLSASFGYDKREKCKKHKLEGMTNLTRKPETHFLPILL